MKNLFHNEHFRRKFYRYLGMYIGVLLLFTTVVTYSKYVSMLSSESSARVAKFNIDIDYFNVDGCNPGEDEEICEAGYYRPATEIPYYFKASTEFEVSVFFVLSISVATDFEIVGLYAKSEEEGTYEEIDLMGKRTLNEIKLETVKAPNEGKNTYYKLIVKYKGDNLVYHNQEIPYYEYQEKNEISKQVVTVDYSAVQLKGGK